MPPLAALTLFGVVLVAYTLGAAAMWLTMRRPRERPSRWCGARRRHRRRERCPGERRRHSRR